MIRRIGFRLLTFWLVLTTGFVALSDNTQFIREYFGLEADVPIEHRSRFYDSNLHYDCDALECMSFLSILELQESAQDIFQAVYESIKRKVEENKRDIRNSILLTHNLLDISEYGRPREALLKDWIEDIERRENLIQIAGTYVCNGFSSIVRLSCSVELDSESIDHLGRFINNCRRDVDCVMDLSNSPSLRNEVSNEFLRLISKLRLLENFETEIIPGMFEQLKSLQAFADLSFRDFSQCMENLDDSFFNEGIRHTMDEICTKTRDMNALESKLSPQGLALLERVRYLGKRVIAERPRLGKYQGYIRTACWTNQDYNCDLRARCLKDYLTDRGIPGVKYIYTRALNTYYDAKRRMTFTTENIRLKGGPVYSFHVSVAVEIEGEIVILDPNVARYTGQNPMTLDQWKRAFEHEKQGQDIAAMLEVNHLSHPTDDTDSFTSERTEFTKVPGRHIRCEADSEAAFSILGGRDFK